MGAMSDPTPKENTQDASRLIVAGVVACFVLSGFAALLYQTAWMRQFSLVFGTSELAVAAVLSAYMGGLALGAIVAARFVHRITRPVLFYGLLEGGIAISALSVPSLLKLASLAYVAVFGGQPEPVDASGLGQSFFYLAIAFVVIALPTCFMGATLPLLTKYVVRTKEQIGSRVGLLYATNTAGAIGGTVVAGFVLLPALGLSGTVYVGVAVNGLVFVLAVIIARAIGRLENSGDTPAASVSGPSRRLWILPLMLLSGMTSFVYEVLWTRLLGHVLGGSITAFATMLAGFLGGIAIGSAIAARFANNQREATRWFIMVQCGIAITSMLIYQLLPLAIPDTPGLRGNVLLAIVVLLPATLFIGATFPLAVRILAIEKTDAAASSARVYSWNTVGAIVGATAAAFFIIPALKYEGAIKFAVVLNVALALGATTLLGRQAKVLIAGVSALLVGLFVFYQPQMPEAILRSSPVFAQPGGEIRYYEVGRSATVIVIEKDGFFNLRTNGLPEASTNLRGAPPDLHNQRLLATVPVLARPDVETMLIVGLGAGAALEGVPPSVKSVDVIELEPDVVRANESIGEERALDPLKDSRVNIVINDARSAMTLTDKRYDAIVSQPSHPWTAGASHLYTREYMTLARDHLTDSGVYLQWMNTQFVDEFLLRGLCATMLDVFSYVRVYQWDSEVLFFLGSEQPLNVEADIVRTGRPLSDDVLGYLEKGIGSVEDVVAALAMDHANVEAIARGGSVITDNRNYMATMSASVINTVDSLSKDRLEKVLNRYDPLLQADSALRSNFPASLNFPYISRRLERKTLKKRAVDLANSLIDAGDSQSLVMIGLGQQRQGEKQESEKNLLLALQADPENQQARYALLQPWLPSILDGEDVPPHILEALQDLAGTAADTYRAWVAAIRGEWFEVLQLDAELASVLPSDLWYETSVKLRADWRIKLTNPEYQPRMANEATQLIDSAIAYYPNQDLHVMRLQSTHLAGDYLASVETARRLIYIMGLELAAIEKGSYPVDQSGIRLRLQRVQQTLALLADVEGDSRVPTYKLSSLRDSAAQVTRRLQALPADTQAPQSKTKED
jgi:spermidine synthase